MPPLRNSSTHKDPIEVRRARGEISCAECRRHKLKCNKAIPCATCIRKGCPEICPNGTLTPGQSNRHASNDVDAQTQKLVQMSKRIQQLEDALQIAHGSLMGTQHPLLSDDLLKIKNFIERPDKMIKGTDASDEDTMNSFGTLTSLGSGMESYVGADKLVVDSLGSADILHLKMNSPAFPSPSEPLSFRPVYLSTSDVQAQIEGRLPSFERASALIEAYLENTAWLLRIVDREQIMEELIPRVYQRRQCTSPPSTENSGPTDPHVLSLLLAIFACGAVADLTLPPWNEEAHMYYDMARIATGLKSIFDGTGVHTVQTLALLAAYDIVACRKNSLEGTWKLISFCMSLAASVGLHRDPTHFNFPPKQVQFRRRLFWELHSMDTWKSFGSGRPMSLYQSVVDCELPDDTDATVLENGETVPSVWCLRYRFAKEVTAEVADKLASARALKYSEILTMDQKIRDFDPDEIVKLSLRARTGSESTTRNILESLILILLKEPMLLLLHRNFFVRALVENPTDPMQSQFAPSFLATYRAASTVLRGLRGLLDEAGHFVVRIWPIWAHALSASVLLGSIAACGTTSAFAPEAFVEFNRSIDMLEKVQMHPVVKDLLPNVLQLRDRAYEALVRHGNGIPYPFRQAPLLRPPTVEGKDFNSLSSMGWMVRKIQSGQFGPPPQRRGLVEYLDMAMPRADTPTTISPLSSTGGSDFQNTASTSGDSVFNHDRARASRSTPVELLSQSMRATPSDITIIAGNSSHANATQQMSGVPQPSFADEHALYLPSELQAGFLHSGASFSADSRVNTQDFGLLHSQMLSPSQTLRSRLEDLNSPQSTSNAAFGTYPSGLDGDLVDTHFDTTEPPLNFDSLSDFSLDSLLNSDFDVSFNMRSSAGDESIVSLIPDDLAPCRTILQDSRFFGNGPNISSADCEKPNGRC